jgi:hypothetical protein
MLVDDLVLDRPLVEGDEVELDRSPMAHRKHDEADPFDRLPVDAIPPGDRQSESPRTQHPNESPRMPDAVCSC